MLIAMMGPPASGKSVIAEQLALRLPADLLNKDRVRAALFSPEQIEYSSEQDDFCLELMYETADHLMKKDETRHVIIDGRTFGRREQRDALKTAAEHIGTQLCLVECTCSEESARQRLAKARKADDHPAKNRDMELYRRVKSYWEPVTEDRLVLDTDALDEATCVERAIEYIRAYQ